MPAGLAAAAAPAAGELATLVWVGRGEAERLEGGVWRRAPQFDYDFSVEQHRFADRWESVKTMRRRHPAYDGSAGPRVQSYVFRLELAPAASAGDVDYRITSSLGRGTGRGDREFRKAVLEIDADVSMFAPFNRYRITQDYRYEQGELLELVELNDGSSPWVRNHEQARLFGATSYPQPPTRLGDGTPSASSALSAPELAAPSASAATSSGAVAASVVASGVVAVALAPRGARLAALGTALAPDSALTRCLQVPGEVRACAAATLRKWARRALRARGPGFVQGLRAAAAQRQTP